ncbi:nitroreductase family protein [Microcoleus vaginatus GB1-A2]|uniref:nitroreductase family protein n=1 Tax=Microcoleus vaginatus TaxID=119532 RepID=UPI0032AD92A7
MTKEEGRRQKEEGRGKKEEGRRKKNNSTFLSYQSQSPMPNAPIPMPNAQLPITNYPLGLSMTIEIQPSINVKTAIETRRAARSFQPDPIPPAILAEILRLGVRSPSGYNLQPWRFIVLQDQASKEKLKACAFDQRQVVEAPTVLICCGDRRATGSKNTEAVIELGKTTGAMNDNLAGYMRQAIPQLFENRPSFDSLEAWTNRHTMLAVAHLMIAAKSFGVDSCPMEGFVSAKVKEAFQIPEEVDVCCLLPLGYAAQPLKQYGGRFDVTQVYYSESYGQALQAEI